MKSLSQVEPRIPIDSLASISTTGRYGITQSGSYYLTGNISRSTFTAAIEIQASDVVIDLNGYGIVETTGTNVAFRIERTPARSNIKIMNGYVEGPSMTVIQGAAATNFINNLHLADLRIFSTNNIGTVCSLFNIISPRAERVQISNMSFGLEWLVSSGGAPSGVITDCSAHTLANASGTCTAFGADVVQNCSVISVQGTTTVVGINGLQVRGCSVTGVTSTSAAGVATGVRGETVVDCNVKTIGTSGVGGSATGISGQVVRGCNVNTVGSLSSGGGVVGISAPNVEDCVISSVNGGTASPVYGILGTVATRSFVSTINQGSNPSGTCIGIFGRVTSNCHVFSVKGNTGGATAAIVSASVLGCRVNTVENAGAGEGNGILFSASLGEAGSVVADCAVTTVKNHGVSTAVTATIRNSAFNNCGVAVANGAGVLVNSSGVRVDSCNITNSDVGIRLDVDSPTIFVIRNTVSSCPLAITGATTSRVAPFLTGGGAITDVTPWSNFSEPVP